MFEGWSSHNTTAVLNGSLVALVTDGQLPLTVTAGRNIQVSCHPFKHILILANLPHPYSYLAFTCETLALLESRGSNEKEKFM